MRPQVLSIAPYAAADVDFVAVSQTPAAGGIQELTLTANPVVLDVPRQITVVSAGDDSGRIFVIEGTGPKGNQQIEAINGANAGTAQTVLAFATVTSIKTDANTAAAVSSGTTTVVQTNWFPLDYLRESFKVTLNLTGVTAATNADFTVQFTTSRLGRRGDDPQPTVGQHLGSVFDMFYPTLLVANHDTIAAVTDDAVGNIIVPVTAIRLQSNAVFTGNSVQLGVVQAGHGS